MKKKKKMPHLEHIARSLRRLILRATTAAGSGHPTSALSATELMTALLFGGAFRYDIEHPENPNNDRLIFSKGHATPLYYALWTVVGAVSEEALMRYRRFDSVLQGHPVPEFAHVDAATGSLGQGLSIGLGMALNAKYLDRIPYNTYVLLGDSEMAEGSQWEALQIAAHYELTNLIGILDVNRLGQRGETMVGENVETYRRRVEVFGWVARVVDGHSFLDILDALSWAVTQKQAPCMIIAKTVKGKGVSFLEDQNGWHGKALDEDQLEQALNDIGGDDEIVRGTFTRPTERQPAMPDIATGGLPPPTYEAGEGESVPTRNAYGNALKRIASKHPRLVALDGEVCNSTRAEYFRDAYPDRFFEMYVAEQNMVGAAVGLACRGRIPFVSTFAAFFTRAFDQIRMAQYSEANVKFVGSHAGVAIGEDGPSQMGLEDIAMFRTLLHGVVLHPCDAMSTERLVERLAEHRGIAYLRTLRGATPVIYSVNDEFPIGGCKVLRSSENDVCAVVAAGITVHEALKAHEQLLDRGIHVRVIDLYSIKPLDHETLRRAADDCRAILTVEDHYPEGGLGEAVASALSDRQVPMISLAVGKIPRSGTSEELLRFEGIDANAIIGAVQAIGKSR